MNSFLDVTTRDREWASVLESFAAFQQALRAFELDAVDYVTYHQDHWLRSELTLFRATRRQKGQLSDDQLTELRRILTMPTLDKFLMARLNFVLESYGIPVLPHTTDQLLHTTLGSLNAIHAAYYLSQWKAESKEPLIEEAVQALAECFRHYHAAWDLQSQGIEVLPNHAASSSHPDRATAFLCAFARQLPADLTDAWTESNWLLVRRLLSYLVGDRDIPSQGEPNQVQMLLACSDGQDYRGKTAPVDVSVHLEGFASAYLDPVALGVTVLDPEMLDSLRIAARIAKPILEKKSSLHELAMRIGPNPGAAGLLVLEGGSAGGIVTLAACATAEGHRLNRDVTASFTVKAATSGSQPQASLPSPTGSEAGGEGGSPLTMADIRFGPVWHESIEAKLTSTDFQQAGLKTVFLHHTQTSGPEGRAVTWTDWVPDLEQSAGLRIRPVDEGLTLAHLIHEMTGDERIERVLTQHADAVFAEWEQIKNATEKSPHSLWDEQDEHRLDHYVWPNYRIELPESEDQRSERMQKHQEPPAEPVPGDDTERERELLRRLIQGPKFLVVYDNAGAGKTVFSRRVRTDATSVEMRRELFEGHAPLVVRCDGEWQRDKSKGLMRLRERLTQELLATLETPPVNPEEIIDYALKNRRVIMIVDGFDQFDEKERQHVVDLLRNDKTARDQCYWIITSRVHTIDGLRNTLFIDRDWDRVRIDPFDEEQQDRYFNDKGDSWLQTVPNRESMAELLKLPMVLRQIRRLIDETPPDQSPPVFHTLSELFIECAHKLLDRAIRTSKEKLKKAGLDSEELHLGKQRELLERSLATLAFQMMVDQNYNALLDDGPEYSIEEFQENAEDRFCYEQNQKAKTGSGMSESRQNNAKGSVKARQAQWQQALAVLKEIELNHRSVTEAYCPERIAFRSRKMMECYAALYLVKYANEGDRTAILPLLGDPQWDACWGLAIQMPRKEINSSVVERTLALLFEVPAHYPRPTEHMLHAWQLMKRDPLRYPGLEATLRSYRQQFLDILFGPDEDRAERAAEVITPEDFEKYLKSLSAASCSPLPSGEGPGVREISPERAAVPQRSAPSPAWINRIRRMYTARPTFSVISDATKPEKFRQAASLETRTRHYTDPANLTFLMGASPEDTSAGDAEKYDKSSEETWWIEQSIPAFQMATCCVTRAQYRLFDLHQGQPHLGETYDPTTDSYGASRYSPDEDCPMIEVNWWDAFCFGLWPGEEYQLPTEVQWEGAAWGGIDRDNHRETVVSVPPYHAGFTSNEVNHDGSRPIKGQQPSDESQRTLPVRWDDQHRMSAPQPERMPSAYKANGFGLWHVNGNVWEWCESGWADTLKEAIAADGKDVAGENVNPRAGRVVRGGSWFIIAGDTRTSGRDWDDAEDRVNDLGFRLSRTF